MGIRARLWPGLSTRGIWLEVVLALLGTLLVGINVGTSDLDWLPVGGVFAGTAVLGVLLLLFRRRAPLIPFVVSVFLAAVSTAVAIGILLTCYAVARYIADWRIRIAAGVVAAIAVTQAWGIDSANEAFASLGGAAVVVLLPGALGAWARTRSDLVAALTERAERAEAERELMAREAVLNERTRIAREMHDAVGHRVSLMVLQAGAIEMAAADRDRVEQLACNVQSAGRQALEELRQMVGVLRGGDVDDEAPLGPQPGLEDLTALVAHARQAGMTVELHQADGAASADPLIGRAAYRIVQEALTNAGKHAPGAAVSVDVERHPDDLLIRVVNGAPAAPVGPAPGGGYGLVGLGERVRTLGGQLRAEPRLDGGFGVEAVLPDVSGPGREHRSEAAADREGASPRGTSEERTDRGGGLGSGARSGAPRGSEPEAS
jgi:signal transduction histidine kinase